MKSVQIRSFSVSYFPVFELIYSVNLRVQSDYRKIRTRKNSVFGYFHALFRNYFRKTLEQRCLTGFWIHICYPISNATFKVTIDSCLKKFNYFFSKPVKSKDNPNDWPFSVSKIKFRNISKIQGKDFAGKLFQLILW